MVNDKNLQIISYYKLDCYRRSFAAMLATYKQTYVPLLLSQFGAFDVVNDEILYYPIKIFEVERILLDVDIRRKNINVDRDNFIDFLCSQIDLNHVVIVWMDLYYNPSFSCIYLKKHSRHSVIVLGYSKENETFQIVDSNYYEDFTLVNTTISFDDLYNSFFSYVDYYNYESTCQVFETVLDNFDKKKNQEINIKYIEVFRYFLIRNRDLLKGLCAKLKLYFDKVNLDEWFLRYDCDEQIKKCDRFYIALNNGILIYQVIYAFSLKYMKNSKLLNKHLAKLLDVMHYIRAIFYKIKFTTIMDMNQIAHCNNLFHNWLDLLNDVIDILIDEFRVEHYNGKA